jgi:hypothetical protein
LEGHDVVGSEPWRDYQARREADAAAGTGTRGPYEQAADQRALARLDDPAVRKVLSSSPEDVAADLVADARRYGPFER